MKQLDWMHGQVEIKSNAYNKYIKKTLVAATKRKKKKPFKECSPNAIVLFLPY